MNLNYNRDHTGELDIKRLGSVLMQIIVSMELIWNVNISCSDEKCFNFLDWNKSSKGGLMWIIGVLSDLICFLFISDLFPVPSRHSSPLSIWVCQPALCQWRSGQHPPLPSSNNYSLHQTSHSCPPATSLNQIICMNSSCRRDRRKFTASFPVSDGAGGINILESSKYLIFLDSRHQNFTMP